MKKILLFTFLLSIIGCSSEAVKKDTVLLKSEMPVYAKIEKLSGGYRFTKYSNKPPLRMDLPWVELRSGEPFWDIGDKRCGYGLIKDRNKKVPSCSVAVREDLFYESRFDYGDAAIRVISSPFNLFLTLTGVSFDVEFDRDAFNEAYSEAVDNIDLNRLRAAAEVIDGLNKDYLTFLGVYQARVDSINKEIIVNDRSGFYDDSLNLSRHVSIRMNHLADIPRVEVGNLDALESAIKHHKSSLLESWDLNSSFANIGCPQERLNARGFNYAIKCPGKIVLSEKVDSFKVVVDVFSKNFDKVVPKSIFLENEDITLELSQGMIGISNNTPNYIIVRDISYYYAGKISTLKGVDIELPPNSRLTSGSKISLRKFDLIDDVISYSGLTMAEAKKKYKEYGFAVKYDVNGGPLGRTLFSTKKYQIAELLAQR